MKKEKRLVVVERSKNGTNTILIMNPADSEHEALQNFMSFNWQHGDNYGVLPYLANVIIDDDEFYVPTDLEWQEPLTTKYQGY